MFGVTTGRVAKHMDDFDCDSHNRFESFDLDDNSVEFEGGGNALLAMVDKT